MSTPSTTAQEGARKPGARTTPAWWDTAVLTVLSTILALALGAVLIVVSDPQVQDALSYFTARPGDTFSAAWTSVSSAYSALFRGAFIDWQADTLGAALKPIAETLTFAAPLICAGLGVALAFRAGLFNIGAEGQIVIGAATAGYVGFALDLPVVVHLVVAVSAGILGGALWAGIAGILKARTGAHEVITTIMLNYIAFRLLDWLLTLEAFQRPGRNDPLTPPMDAAARYPLLLGSSTRLHAGFLVALVAAIFVWWLLQRSTVGFRLRAVGANPAAARTAGMDVGRTTIVAMLLAGGLAGLASTMQVLGTEEAVSSGISAGVGFDAITVALLGRGSPLGVVLAGILFGGLNAGGVAMQAQTGTPIDVVLVVQSLIVLFIAAPPLVRSIFRLPAVGSGGSLQMSKGWNA